MKPKNSKTPTTAGLRGMTAPINCNRVLVTKDNRFTTKKGGNPDRFLVFFFLDWEAVDETRELAMLRAPRWMPESSVFWRGRREGRRWSGTHFVFFV